MTNKPIDQHAKQSRASGTRTAGLLITKEGPDYLFTAEGSMLEVMECFAQIAHQIARRMEADLKRPVSAFEALQVALHASAQFAGVSLPTSGSTAFEKPTSIIQ